MNQRTTQSQLLLHSPRKFSGFPFLERLYLLVDSFYQPIVLLNCCSEKSGKKLQILFHRQIGIKGESPRHIAHTAADSLVILHRIESIYCNCPFIGIQQSSQHPEQRSLARPVGTYDTKNFTRHDFQADMLQSLHLPVTFGNIVYRYQRFHGSNNFTSPYIPNFNAPSFCTAIFTAYTRLARSSRVWMVLGVNSACEAIHVIRPGYSFRSSFP